MSLLRAILNAIPQIVSKKISRIRTHIPAQVVEYNSGENTVTVQPCIDQFLFTNPEKVSAPLPKLKNIPVSQRGSGKLWITVAPQAGSYGTVHVFDRSIEKWLQVGGQTVPGSLRTHDLSDSEFVPDLPPLVEDGDNGKIATGIDTDRICLRTRSGLTKISVLDDESVEIKNENATVTIAVNGEITCECPKFIVNDETDSAALASKLDAWLTTADTVLRTWTPGAADSGAALKTAWIAAFPSAPTTTASTKLKVDS
jgi:hypothetical protein